MKTIFLSILILLCCTLVYSDELEKIRSTHISMMKYHGHGDLLVQKNSKMIYMSCGKEISSLFYSDNMGTGYVESQKAKMYWTVQKKAEGVMVVIIINMDGTEYKRAFSISDSQGEMTIKDMNWQAERIKVDWDCIKNKFPTCALSCLGNWVACLACIGEAAWKCVDWW